jgi:hypothetical protein
MVGTRSIKYTNRYSVIRGIVLLFKNESDVMSGFSQTILTGMNTGLCGASHFLAGLFYSGQSAAVVPHSIDVVGSALSSRQRAIDATAEKRSKGDKD